jgi:hypothetical protein
MNTTLITVIDNNNFETTLESVIKNSITPKIYCIAVNKDIDIKIEDILNKYSKSLEKRMDENNTIYTTNINNIQIIVIQSAEKNLSSLKSLCVGYTINVTDTYIVVDNGIKLMPSALSLIINKLKDFNIGFVYSDYIEKDIYKFQPSFHAMMKRLPSIKLYGIRSNFSHDMINNNHETLASNLYGQSIISKIPEALFTV